MHRFLRTLVTVAAMSLVLGGGAAAAQTNTIPTVVQGGNPDATAVQNSPGGATTPTAAVRGLDSGEEVDEGDEGSSILPWVLTALVAVLVLGGVAALMRRRTAAPAGR